MLPARKPTLPHTISVETERFYSALADLGYEFKERFRSLSGLQRKLNRTTCFVTPEDSEGLIVHPAVLDAALQSIILAYRYPYDDHLRTLHLLTRIKCIRINPTLFGPLIPGSESLLQVATAVSPQEAGQEGIVGYVNLYNSTTSPRTVVQVQCVSFIPLGSVAAEKDKKVFSGSNGFNAGPTDSKQCGASRLLRAAIEYHCRNFLSQEMLHVSSSPVSSDNDLASARTLGGLLRRALDYSRRFVLGRAQNTPVPWPGVLPLDHIARESHPPAPLAVVDWMISAFAAQMRTILQMTTSDEDMMALRSGDMVSVPVLKIMGNETMASLVEFVVENLPLELVPGLADAHAGANERQGIKDSGEVSSVKDTSTEETSRTPVTQPDLDRVDGPGEHKGKIDWEAESCPPAHMVNTLAILEPRRVRFPPRVVVLTGCTGFLGHHLLSYLIADPTVEKVICLAVWSLSSRLQHGRLPRSPRVVYYEGDLGQPLLGLSEEEAALIFDETDAVIHNRSDTSHLKHYVYLRISNVDSTAVIAQFCIPRRIPLHYVSSAGVGIFHEKSATEGFPPGPVRPAPDWKSDGSFGCICGKWVCERLLERTSQMYGLHVCIHRPSTILREGDDAIGEEADKDWVNTLLAFVRRLKAAPTVDRNPGTLDLVYVKTVCEAMIEKGFKGTAQGEGIVAFVHEVGDKLVPLSGLHDIGLDESQRAPFAVLPLDEWMAKAVLAGMYPGVAVLISEMVDTGKEYPKLLKSDGAYRV
ncbi:male sterility protein-domain-containing protein [Ustulina deusta]|nr:male sterility protein-domain-containing protein [Ustulina deusta]